MTVNNASESVSLQGWSQTNLQNAWSAAVGRELAQVAAFDPLPGHSPPEELPAFQAVHWEVGAMGVDLRPHVFDPGLNRWLLCDSGRVSKSSNFEP